MSETTKIIRKIFDYSFTFDKYKRENVLTLKITSLFILRRKNFRYVFLKNGKFKKKNL